MTQCLSVSTSQLNSSAAGSDPIGFEITGAEVESVALNVLTQPDVGNREEMSLADRFIHRICHATWYTIRITYMAISAILNYIAVRFWSGSEVLARRVFHSKKREHRDNKFVAPANTAYSENTAKMKNISLNAKDAAQLRQAEFLKQNYLGKVAPTHMDILNKVVPEAEKQYQVGKKYQYQYHRYGFVDKPDIAQAQNNRYFALADVSPLIPTDTIEFTHLYSLSFQPVEGTNFPYATLKQHFDAHPKKALSKPLQRPLMFDLTDQFTGMMDIHNEAQAKAQLKSLKRSFSYNIDQTVELLHDGNPHYSKSQIRKWMKDSCVFISRVKEPETGISGIKVLPIFKSMTGGNYVKAYPSLVEFISNTGIFISAVNLRRQIWVKPFNQDDVQSAKPLVDPSQIEEDEYFQNTKQILESNIISRCLKSFQAPERPHFDTLGMGTLALFSGLLNEISPMWDDIHQDPFKASIVQASLTTIIIKLLEASKNADENQFDSFALNIELVHAEFASVLEVTRPFSRKHYNENYRRMLGAIPGIDAKYVQPGLCKTGVNAFAGINAAIARSIDQPVRAYGKGFYFEQAGFIGYDHTLESILDDDTVEKVDLYACQFNSNIEIDSDFTHYEGGKVEQDIRAILEKKPKTDHLTVAVDCTIDFINSNRMKDLLYSFRSEVAEGRLNFVFFRSGQKLDQFGMDSYYGAPFVQVNNGEAHWDAFKNIHTEDVYQTDPLSLQWFSLAFTYATPYLEKYRELIFENARSILDQLPAQIKPAKNLKDQKIRVNSVADDFLPSFIDIKVSGPMHELRAKWILAFFYERFHEAKRAINSRASFGFIQPNFIIIQINEVPDTTTIRLSPGIDPTENALISKLIEEIGI